METQYHETAGGVVVDATGRILVLERYVSRNGEVVHEIRLPKGHVDEGESHEAAAMREVGEESGYWQVEIVGDLGTAHSTFSFLGKRHERDEHYFLMRTNSGEYEETLFDAGSEEALFKVKWLAPTDAAAQMTFHSERAFVERAVKQLATEGNFSA